MGGLVEAGGDSTFDYSTPTGFNDTVSNANGNAAMASNDQVASQMAQQASKAEGQGAPQAGNTTLGPTAKAIAFTGQGITAGNTNIAPSTQYLNQMNGVNQSLTNTMNGTGPSVASNQLAQGEQQQVANQMAVLGSQRGGNNNALAARTAAGQSAAGINALQQQQANARIQEGTAATGQLSNNLTNASGQVIGLNEDQANLNQNNNQFNAGQNQNMTLANMAANNAASATNAGALNNANLQQGSMNQATTQANLASQLQTMGLNNAQIQAMLSGQVQANNSNANIEGNQNQQTIQQSEAEQQALWDQTQASSKAAGAGVNSLFQSVAGMSDENLKTDIEDAKARDVQEMLDQLTAHTYRYKDEVQEHPLAGKDRYMSVMAQDLQKSELGKSMVEETPDGLAVNYGKGFGALLAAQVLNNERLKKLEGK